MNALLAALLLLADPDPARTVNRVAAVVNGEAITMRELSEAGGPEWQAMEAMPAGAEREQIRLRLLRAIYTRLLADRLLEGQVRELKIEVSDGEVQAAIEDKKRQYKIDDATLERALAGEGLTLETYRLQLRKQIAANRVLMERVGPRIRVGDDDVRAYHVQHAGEFVTDVEARARHVFLPLAAGAPGADEARVKAIAEKVVARARAGEDFARLARELSQGPSAREGGDLGWLKRGVVQPEVERAVFALAPGEVSDPVRTKTGFQILKVEERRGGAPRPFDEVKEEIRNRLALDQQDAALQQYLTELKKDAVVDVRMAELKE